MGLRLVLSKISRAQIIDEFLVLLMDEADVFLEERTMADLQRNSLVSGMLAKSARHVIIIDAVSLSPHT
jgi:hypothetical protein